MKPLKYFAPLIVIAGFLLAVPTDLSAQSNHWISVKALPPKTEIIVLRNDGDREVGYVGSVTDDSIAMTTDSGASIIARNNVKKIYYAVPRNKRKSMNRGALVGGLLGLAAGVAVAYATPSNSEAMHGGAVFLAGGLLGGYAGRKRADGKDRGALIYSEK